MKKFYPAFLLLSVIVLFPSYRLKPGILEERSALARSSNQFTFAFFHAMLKDDTANRLVSPVGVYLGLNLLYNAAARDTRDSIGYALQVVDMDIHQLNAQSKNLLQQFSLSDKKAHFSMANACSFNAGWQRPFDAKATQEDFFYLSGGHRMVASFMHKLSVTRTYSDTSFTMVELPYGNGNAYSLFVVLPNDLQQNLRDFTATFQGEKLFEAMTRMNAQWVDLSLPRWEQRVDAGDMLPGTGMTATMPHGSSPSRPAGPRLPRGKQRQQKKAPGEM